MQPYSNDNHRYIIQPWDNLMALAERFNTSEETIMEANPEIYQSGLFIGQMINIPVGLRAGHCISEKELELKSKMRLLWEQHVSWTRMTIISLTFNLPDVNFVVARLLRNATDMGNSLKPYYGVKIGEMYASLIREHLLLAADLVKAVLAGNAELAAETERKWYANADQIAQFLSHINPYLTEEEVRKMFYEHLALTKTEAVSMINMDYKTDVEVFDKIEAQALVMADAISNAIVKQFPHKFN